MTGLRQRASAGVWPCKLPMAGAGCAREDREFEMMEKGAGGDGKFSTPSSIHGKGLSPTCVTITPDEWGNNVRKLMAVHPDDACKSQTESEAATIRHKATMSMALCKCTPDRSDKGVRVEEEHAEVRKPFGGSSFDAMEQRMRKVHEDCISATAGILPSGATCRNVVLQPRVASSSVVEGGPGVRASAFALLSHRTQHADSSRVGGDPSMHCGRSPPATRVHSASPPKDDALAWGRGTRSHSDHLSAASAAIQRRAGWGDNRGE